MKMNRNSVNVAKTKKLISGAGNNSKHNRKTFHNISDSSSISSNRNSSAHSEEDVRVSGVYLRPQVDKNASFEEQEEQVTKRLQAKVKELRHKLRILEESVDSKDYSLGTIAREKDRAIGEIRRLERSNKLLRQQLNDERNHYLEEKEKFCEEMTKYKKKLQDVKSDTDGKKTPSLGRQPLINQSLRWQFSNEKGDFAELRPAGRRHLKKSKTQVFGIRDSRSAHLTLTDSQLRKPNSLESFHLYEGDDVSLQMAALRTENAKLRSIICERDERNYELCLRFLRMKHYKNDIKDRFQDLESEYLQVIANLMDKIDEARQEFNFIIDQKFKRPLHSTNAMYLHMVQKNSRMAFENASLRLENQCLKKELNKHVNSSSECDRKAEAAPAADEADSKLEVEDNKSETKLKRIKKNVNFKEIRTIYERCLTFKTSDTDSNYMSKTSTTVPSNGSLVDPKSNESIIADEQSNSQTAVHQPTLKANALPDEILQKIFKRIDTSSCQTVDSGRSKEQINAKTEEGHPETKENKLKSNEKQEDKLPEEEDPTKTAQDEAIIIEHKSPPKLTDSSSPCESKESIRFHLKDTSEASNKTEKPKKENYFNLRREDKSDHPWAFKNRLKNRVRCDWSFDRDSEGSSSLDFPLRRFTLAGRTRWGRQEKTSQAVVEGDVPQTRRIHQLGDNCGLQVKLDFSDLELSGGVASQTAVEPVKANEATESEDDLEGKMSPCGTMKSLPPAVGSRSRSSNKVNLQEELMEATMRQYKFADMHRRKENKLQAVQSKTSTNTYEHEHENPISDRNTQSDIRKVQVSNQETELAQKKPEASKRFSQRLFSTSPEQLKNILTESQLGPFKMAPIIVGHATTEMAPAFKYGEASNEVFLQLVLPSSSPRYSSLFSDNDTAEKTALEKEASTHEISPVHPSKLSNQTEACTSDIRIPISSLPTSNSTMEMVDSATFGRNNIMMRTLSAPGLLESNWLDPYTVCETRDCSTNTLPCSRLETRHSGPGFESEEVQAVTSRRHSPLQSERNDEGSLSR